VSSGYTSGWLSGLWNTDCLAIDADAPPPAARAAIRSARATAWREDGELTAQSLLPPCLRKLRDAVS
jgi:hypothetical protein